jgi:Protein of unknown function (DUF4231)
MIFLGLSRRVKNTDFPDFMETASAHISYVRHVYDLRARWHRRLYRLSGIIIILAGSSLPLLTTLSFPHKSLVISLIGVLVSALTALHGFYRWDRSWILLRVTEFAITELRHEWLGTVDDKADPSDKVAADARRQATLDMLKKLEEIRRSEASSYFKDLSYPQKGG